MVVARAEHYQECRRDAAAVIRPRSVQPLDAAGRDTQQLSDCTCEQLFVYECPTVGRVGRWGGGPAVELPHACRAVQPLDTFWTPCVQRLDAAEGCLCTVGSPSSNVQSFSARGEAGFPVWRRLLEQLP